MRGRSLHSSVSEKYNTKEDSCDRPKGKILDDDNIKSVKSDKPEWVSGRVDVTTMIKKLLEQKERKSGKYYDLINVMANAYYLEKCYSEIKSKPGNMTKGISNETLDKIN